MSLGAQRSAVQMHLGIKIPLRDGINLNATLYLPKDHPAPSPAIFTLTPYIGQTYHDVGMSFASYGYPFLTVDVRGRGDSEGVFWPFLNEAKDGYDVVEWLAMQSYCDGQVTMWGGSYAGFAQWATAKEFPPHLATIVPVASPHMGIDFPFRNNIAAPYLIQWLTLVSGRTSQDKMFWHNEQFWGATYREWFESGAPFREFDSQFGNPSPIFQEWVSHPHQDTYWDTYNPTSEQYAKLSIPILTITGIYDDDQAGALAHYRKHLESAPDSKRTRHFLVIGPWDHAGTRVPQTHFGGISVGAASVIDLIQLHVQWYAWMMQSGPRPVFLKKPVSYYVMGAEKWRYADTLEAVTKRSEPLYLQSIVNPTSVFTSGSLNLEPPGPSEPDCCVYNPRDVDHAELESTVDPENRVDQRMIHADIGGRLIYHSKPFLMDTEISGFFSLSVWLSIDQPDTDFCVAVYEIDLDASSVLLATDIMRARYRESLREPRLIRSHEPQCFEFGRFTFTSRLVKKGSRLRLTIGAINSIYSQKNYNRGGVVSDESIEVARSVTIKLYHDDTHRSVLYVPFGQPED